MDGVRVSAPRDSQLASARDWADAWQRLTAEQSGRLAEAAGAEVTWVPPRPEKNNPGEGGLLAEAVAYAGEDAVRFALSADPLQVTVVRAASAPVEHAALLRDLDRILAGVEHHERLAGGRELLRRPPADAPVAADDEVVM